MIVLKFPLNITLYSPRPIFTAYINGVSFRCMLDTGADIPVFCKGTELFLELTKGMDGVSEFKCSSIGGFGKMDENVMLWNFDDFILSDKNSTLAYKSMKMAVMNKPNIPCDIILSASMFMKMRYIIDCSQKKHMLLIIADRDIYGVGYYDKKETIYIFVESFRKTE